MTDIRPIAVNERRLRFDALSPDEAAVLFDAAVAGLERDGVAVASDAALDVFAAGGAVVDRAAGRVTIPAAVVRGALDRAPASIALAGRVPDHDVSLSSDAQLLAAAAAAARVIDDRTGEERAVTAADVTAACRLADALPEVAAVWAPPALEACLAGTTKHVMVADAADADAAEALIAVAATLAGSAAAVRERPPLSALQSRPWSGATAGAHIDAALACAGAGLPVGFVLPPSGDAAPADVPAAIVAVVAAGLAAGTLAQLAAPGCAFVLPALPGLLEALAPGAGSGPGAARVVLGVSQVAAIARLPLVSGFAAASAASPTWESAADNLFAGMVAALSRCGLVCGAGLLDDGTAYSAVQMLLDAETFTNTAAVGAGIVVDDETIAMDVILTAGDCGNALGHKHTRRHMRDVWRPRLFDRTSHEAWAREGRRDATDRARDLADELLAGHDVPPLEAETSATLRRIIEKAGL